MTGTCFGHNKKARKLGTYCQSLNVYQKNQVPHLAKAIALRVFAELLAHAGAGLADSMSTTLIPVEPGCFSICRIFSTVIPNVYGNCACT